ncbi:MAG TPA: hypothetical protein VM266_15520 [Solirubrobacteraceae bacterium]|nr:hypothetical protein [Solirubrobacteraceae bacterium]
MRPLLAVLILLALPAAAPAKGIHDSLRVEWRSIPDGLRAGETWAARFVLLAPNDTVLLLYDARPVVRLSSDAREVRAPARMRGNGEWVARVRLPAAGSYRISLEGFDPRDPQRFLAVEPPLRVPAAAAAPAPGDGRPPWPLLAAAPVAALGLVLARRRRPAR